MQRKTSIAELKKKIDNSQSQNPSSGANTQQKNTYKDLEDLRLAGEKRRQLTPPPAATPDTTNAWKEKEQPRSGLSSLKERLFANPSESRLSAQKQATENELKKLQAPAVSVKEKARLLEEYFSRSNQVLEELKQNKVSEEARKELTLPHQLDHFEQQQGAFIEEIKVKLEEDIQQYANSPELQKMGYARFLELSFTYRSYEVCLEQDFRRHVAVKIQNSRMPHTLSDKEDNISLSCGIPNKLAVQSLNYYMDFFNKLSAIETIWSYAGTDIRKAEVRLIFAVALYNNMKVLSSMLGNHEEKAYLQNLGTFEDALSSHISKCPFFQEYIKRGNGLNESHHPWVVYGCSRLEQPNNPIDFSKIIPVDAMHAEVKDRVQTDQRLRMK